jgi:arylsulfatase A-like enzyme
MTHLVQPYEQNVFRYLKNAGYTTVHLGKNDELAAESFKLTYTYWEGNVGQARMGTTACEHLFVRRIVCRPL